MRAQHVATFNPAANQWSSLGAGLDQAVHALAVLPNGELVAGGRFQNSGGQPTGTVARWDGFGWTPFAGGVVGVVWDLEVAGSGTLLVAGSITQAGGAPVGEIAAWDGAGWSTFGIGFNGVVRQVSRRAVAAPAGEPGVYPVAVECAGQLARCTRFSGTFGGLPTPGTPGCALTVGLLRISGCEARDGCQCLASKPRGVDGRGRPSRGFVVACWARRT
ncbi:MAG: hypothetical protein AB8H80_12695 [Planctomycetota bacterium]